MASPVSLVSFTINELIITYEILAYQEDFKGPGFHLRAGVHERRGPIEGSGLAGPCRAGIGNWILGWNCFQSSTEKYRRAFRVEMGLRSWCTFFC